MSNDFTQPPALPQEENSLVARMLNVFAAPGESFDAIKSRPVNHRNWLIPALVFVLAGWIAGSLVFSSSAIQAQILDIQEQAMSHQPQNKNLSPAQLEQVRAIARISQAVGIAVVPFFHAAIKVFGGGFVLWLGAMFVLRRPLSYLKCVELAGLCLLIGALGVLVKGLLNVGMGTMFTGPGPVLLVAQFDPKNLWHAAAIAVDVFTLWMIGVRAVGLAKLCEVSFVKALAWVIGVWLVLTGGQVLLGWLSQKLLAAATGQH